MDTATARRRADDGAHGAAVEVRTVEVDGRRVRVGIRRGAPGGTPLLIFNGIGANLELMEPFTAALDGMETIVFDVPGVGGSDLPALPYRFSGLAGMASRLLTQLGYHQPVDVLGISWGGALAQQFAFQYATRCRRLVLAAIAPPRGMAYAFQLFAAWGWTSLFWLRLLRQPTLVMAGSDDPIVPLVNARIMARVIRQSTLVVVDDGHLFLVTRPLESAAAVRGFLNG